MHHFTFNVLERLASSAVISIWHFRSKTNERSKAPSERRSEASFFSPQTLSFLATAARRRMEMTAEEAIKRRASGNNFLNTFSKQ